MTVKTEGVASGSPAARTSGNGSTRARTMEPLSRADRAARGKDARAVAPLESHAEFAPAGSRDPVGLLLGQAKSRVPELVPVRHGRMLVSPFTFYRGAALPMAADLAGTPASGLRVQLCGDAHLSNFGAFASPERRLVFDVNDFDETLPGPFEWDVKRLAASLAVAARDNGYPAKAGRKIALAAAERYRTAMREFAEQAFLDVWYAHLDIEPVVAEFRSQVKAKRFKTGEKLLAKAHTADSMKALGKLTTMVDGRRRIISDPPMIVPIEEVFAERAGRRDLPAARHRAGQVPAHPAVRPAAPAGAVHAGAGGPQGRRGRQRRHPRLGAADGRLRRGRTAVPAGQGGPAVGPGGVLPGAASTPTRASASSPGSTCMQAQSDIFLGWTRVPNPIDGIDRDFYVRQLKDWKFSVPIELLLPKGMAMYARLCGWTLARAHARSGDRIALAAYLGGSAKFDQAIADFAETYADQNERDYAALQAAVKDGRAEATTEI